MLKFDATHEYFFTKASMFYCDDHDTLRICNNYEDSLLISGITRSDVDEFIKGYKKYVLDKDNNVSSKLSTSQQESSEADIETPSY